mgnify:CR=1 FL=1
MAFQLKSRDHLAHPTLKRRFNRELFQEVAPHYNFVTRALSLGRDRVWKRNLVNRLPDLPAPRCLDLACGTGDLAILLKARFPQAQVTGLDLTPAMVDLARARRDAGGIEFVLGDMTATGWPDESADLITGGYALRNSPSLDRAIDEVARVLRRGGTAAFLDFSQPANRIGRWLTYAILKLWGGFWGLAVHRNAEVYAYIAESLRHYPDRRTLRGLFESRGLRLRYRRLHYGGLLESIVVEKSR